jgi:hypothetical protein
VGELALALGPKGALYAAWTELLGEDPPDRVIFWRAGRRFRPGRPVGLGHEATLAVGPDGSIHLAWRSLGEIFYARSDDGGKAFSEPVNVSNTPGGTGFHLPGYSQFPAVAVDVAGKVYLAWQETITADNDEIYLRAL